MPGGAAPGETGMLAAGRADPGCRAGRRGRPGEPNAAIFIPVVTIPASFYHF
jgi:hypothetical protein